MAIPATHSRNSTTLNLNVIKLLGFVLVMVSASLFLTRVLIVPTSIPKQPPVSTLSVAGTVFMQLDAPTSISLTEQGFEFLFQQEILGKPLVIRFLNLDDNQTYDLSNEANPLIVELLDEEESYMSFQAYAGEAKRTDNLISVAALLKTQQGQALSLNGKLELN